MKCHQCERPALYLIQDGKIPICLHCSHKMEEISHMRFLRNAAMMNQAQDDLDAALGIPTSPGRIPVSSLALAMKKQPTLNNISISNSQIGVLNTGSIEKIDAAITLSKGTDAEIVARHINNLIDAVTQSNDIDNNEKNEIIDLAESLSDQIVRHQKIIIIKTIINAIKDRIGEIPSLYMVVNDLFSSINDMFNI